MKGKQLSWKVVDQIKAQSPPPKRRKGRGRGRGAQQSGQEAPLKAGDLELMVKINITRRGKKGNYKLNETHKGF